MSVCRISKNVNQKICRQAFILANLRWRLQPGLTLTRGSHSNLYQMVKKRTLEARTKLQNTNYPNNQPCENPNSNPANTQSQYQAKKQEAGKVKPNKQKICLNTEVLKATNCLPVQSRERAINYDPPATNPRATSGERFSQSEIGRIPNISISSSSRYVDNQKRGEFESENTGDVVISGGPSSRKSGGGFCDDYIGAAKSSGEPCRPAGSATMGSGIPGSAGVGISGSGGGGVGIGSGAGGGAGEGVGGASPKPSKSSSDNSKYWIAALLAALGAGGLILYLLSGKKDEASSANSGRQNGAGTDTNNGSSGSTGRGSGVGTDNKGGSGSANGKSGTGGRGAASGGGVGGAAGTAGGSSGAVTQGSSGGGCYGGPIPASADLPKHVPYLLIGGGAASFSAFRAIKSNDAKAKVLIITNENRKPYMRPPLSKELWYSAQTSEISNDYRFKQWTGAERSLFFEPDEFFMDPAKLMESQNGGIAVAQGFTVKKIDPSKRIATLSDGTEISYDECLIATGCSPKNLSVFQNAPGSVKEKVMVYRTPDDFERLKNAVDRKKSITIIGNGFIGSELACSLANYARDRDIKIYQIFPESGNMSKLLPDYLSKWTTKKVEAQGVCVISNASIKDAKRDEDNLQLKLSNGSTILTDIAVVCVGCEANTSLAGCSGLEVDKTLGGFVVNAELEARRNLFVAGDASCFYDPLLGRRRVEHHDHSIVSGRLAGENMVGKKKPYTHQSMFWSDLGPEIGYEGIGLVDASLPTVGVFALPSKTDKRTDNLKEAEAIESPNSTLETKDLPDLKCNDTDAPNYGRGVIFYMRDGKIVGILLWNLFNRIGLARTIINQNKKFDDLNEVAKLFEIHS